MEPLFLKGYLKLYYTNDLQILPHDLGGWGDFTPMVERFHFNYSTQRIGNMSIDGLRILPRVFKSTFKVTGGF